VSGKWQEDEDSKFYGSFTIVSLELRPAELTFIVCVSNSTHHAQLTDPPTMIGDVNLFLKGIPGDDDFEVEAEIMIAEPAFRRRGIAFKALQLLLSYATALESPSPLPIEPNALVARIGEKNASSIRLFEKLGFVITKRVKVFEEVEMRFRGDASEWGRGETRAIS